LCKAFLSSTSQVKGLSFHCRCLLALGSDETSAARASATCRAFKMAYGAASDEKDRQAIVRRSRERDYKDAVHKMLERVHKEVRDQDENGFFTQAVSPEEAPDYYKMIETPMDLATMKCVIELMVYR